MKTEFVLFTFNRKKRNVGIPHFVATNGTVNHDGWLVKEIDIYINLTYKTQMTLHAREIDT